MFDKQSIKLNNIIYVGILLLVLSKIDLKMRAGLRSKKSTFSFKNSRDNFSTL